MNLRRQPMLLLSAIAGLLLIRVVRYQPEDAITARVVAAVPEKVASARSPRRIYLYSVIPGGAYNGVELRSAVINDPLVREHYRDFALDRARTVVLREDRQQYVSFRIAGSIFWSKKRLLIPKGELLLTDGTHYARTRCGNRLSEKAQEQTAPVEPDPATLNQDPSRTEAVSTLHASEPAHVVSESLQAPGPLSLNRPALSAWNRPAAQTDSLPSPLSWAYINTPALTPVVQSLDEFPPTISVDVPVTPPAVPAAVSEPGTLYLFGVTGLVSLWALLWMDRKRRMP